jgi:hypothetical protein
MEKKIMHRVVLHVEVEDGVYWPSDTKSRTDMEALTNVLLQSLDHIHGADVKAVSW